MDKGKIFCIHELEESILVKVLILPKVIYRINMIPIKIIVSLFIEIAKKIPKCIWNYILKILDSSGNVKQKNKAKSITLLNSELYYKALVMKAAWY